MTIMLYAGLALIVLGAVIRWTIQGFVKEANQRIDDILAIERNAPSANMGMVLLFPPVEGSAAKAFGFPCVKTGTAKINIVHTKEELMVVWADPAAGDVHLIASFPPRSK